MDLSFKFELAMCLYLFLDSLPPEGTADTCLLFSLIFLVTLDLPGL